MVEIGKIFNERSVNIFTDASVRTNNSGITYSSPSIVVVKGGLKNNNIYENGIVLSNSTNNQGEIYAIWMALSFIKSENYTDKTTINIFSDSSISVLGLREWYKSWLNNIDNDGMIYNSSKCLVANQEMFLRCISSILDINIPINIYHICGHMDIGNNKTAHIFNNNFKDKNKIEENLSRSLIDQLIIFNDRVDKYSRSLLTIVNDINVRFPTANFLFKPDAFTISKEKKRYTSLIC